ncbi:unnamed protein product [Allacma fusca]|uniref:E3 ubiquitin-protein ligase n=1 Tax=Allacma fusca TaxID=39272 RepID=A0A8J2P5V0_9HEXA|nr:unnamed protein product [Allacma fusca]
MQTMDSDDLSERTGELHLHQYKQAESKKVAFAEIRSDKFQPKWTNSSPLENHRKDDYNNGNMNSEEFPRTQTPRSCSESSILTNCFEDFESSCSASSILDNEFDEPCKEIPGEELSDCEQTLSQVSDNPSDFVRDFLDEPVDLTDSIPEIITEIPPLPSDEPDPNPIPDLVGGNESPRKEVPDTILIIPESIAQIPSLGGDAINTTPELKDVPDTIITIPQSVVHIPNRSLGRRHFHSQRTDIPRIYDPVNMTVIENSPPEVDKPLIDGDNSPEKPIDLTENSQTSPTDIPENPPIIPVDTANNNSLPSTTDINENSSMNPPDNGPESPRRIPKDACLQMELISQNRGRSDEHEKLNLEKDTDEDSIVDLSGDNLLQNDSDKLVRVSKYESGQVLSENKKDETIEIPKILAGEIVSCRYMLSGCKEKLEKGSMHEQDHYLSCKYRPIKCLLAPACNEVLCHHNYIPHLMQHFMVPTYSKEMVSTVILTPEDFNRGQTWTPKWFSAYDSHFFATISRKENGTWASWVWMLGTTEEAHNFAARITLFKGLKEVSQVFPVHSIRTEQEDIETERTCLLVNDETMLELAQVGKNMFSDFSMRVVLIPNAKELNNTIRENRAMPTPRSRPLRSEKLYFTLAHVHINKSCLTLPPSVHLMMTLPTSTVNFQEHFLSRFFKISHNDCIDY